MPSGFGMPGWRRRSHSAVRHIAAVVRIAAAVRMAAARIAAAQDIRRSSRRGLAGCLHRKSRIVGPPDRAGSRRPGEVHRSLVVVVVQIPVRRSYLAVGMEVESHTHSGRCILAALGHIEVAVGIVGRSLGCCMDQTSRGRSVLCFCSMTLFDTGCGVL